MGDTDTDYHSYEGDDSGDSNADSDEKLAKSDGVKYVKKDKSLKSKITGCQIGAKYQSHAQSPNMSRASSTLSLAPSSCSVTVSEVRDLTDDYQKMLKKATQEIKKLTCQKRKLEKEQDELLTVNIELATEAKRLVGEVKESQKEKKVINEYQRHNSTKICLIKLYFAGFTCCKRRVCWRG